MITKKQEIEKAYSEGLQTGYRLGLRNDMDMKDSYRILAEKFLAYPESPNSTTIMIRNILIEFQEFLEAQA